MDECLSFYRGVSTAGKLKQTGVLQWPDLPVDGLAGILHQKKQTDEAITILETATKQNEEAAKVYTKALKLAKHFGQNVVAKRLQDKAAN